MTTEKLLKLFRQSNALLEGHFILRSGLHSRQYFQCAMLLRFPEVAQEVGYALAKKLKRMYAPSSNYVISPALGGLIIGHEVAKELGRPHIFVEKEDGKLVMRRFKIVHEAEYIVIEDVVTRGGRVQETIDIVRNAGGKIVAVGAIVDRSNGLDCFDFGCPFVSLMKLDIETFEADKLPVDLSAIPAVKPGSK